MSRSVVTLSLVLAALAPGCVVCSYPAPEAHPPRGAQAESPRTPQCAPSLADVLDAQRVGTIVAHPGTTVGQLVEQVLRWPPATSTYPAFFDAFGGGGGALERPIGGPDCGVPARLEGLTLRQALDLLAETYRFSWWVGEADRVVIFPGRC